MGRQENELGSLNLAQKSNQLALADLPAAQLSAYDHDLQEAIRASLQEGQGVVVGAEAEQLTDADLTQAFSENSVISSGHTKGLKQLIPSLREEINEIDIALPEVERLRRVVDDLIEWGVTSEDSEGYLTPISLKAVLSPMTEQVAERYRAYINSDLGFKEVDSPVAKELLSSVLGLPSTTLLKTGDMLRWLRHPLMLNNNDSAPWGLVQFAGGPCGLLATLQSYLTLFLFFRNTASIKVVSQKWFCSKSHLRKALAQALSMAIAQATSEGRPYQLCWVDAMIPTSFNNVYALNDLSCVGTSQPYKNSAEEKTELLANIKVCFKQFEKVDDLQTFLYINLPLLFCAPRVPGCLNLALSLVQSRGLDQLNSEDFEGEKDRSLLGLFGQCNQELVNLMLVGRATSNLFDGNKILGGDTTPLPDESQEIMFLRGVPHRSSIGYLSEMEALRYCEVGDFLKYPYYPIWVCGSSDHFTVVFALNETTAKLGISEYAIKIAEEVFHTVAGEEDESGILDAKHLKHLLEESGFEASPTLLSNAMQNMVQDGQIILRNDFINWFNTYREQSSKINGMDEIEKYRLKDVENSSTRFHLFHYDGQVLVSEQLKVASGPELKFLQLQLLGQGFATTNTQLGRILATRWSPPIEVRSVPTAQVMASLNRLREVVDTS